MNRSTPGLTLDEGYLLTAALPDLQRGIAPLGPPAPAQPLLLGRGVGPPFLLLLSLNSPISSFYCPPFFALSNQTHHSVHKLEFIIELISLSL